MANLLINTTVGGSAVITTSNIGSYALTSIPATISPTNINIGNAIYFGGGNNYLNWSGSRINSNVGIQSAVDMVAPIFYDSDNGAYYGDFASTSVMNAVRLDGRNGSIGAEVLRRFRVVIDYHKKIISGISLTLFIQTVPKSQ